MHLQITLALFSYGLVFIGVACTNSEYTNPQLIDM
jgi:hypothetical protein